MKKSTRRLIRKTVKSVRKNFDQVTRPLGGPQAALTLGAVTVAAAFHPEVRARTKDLALAVVDRFQAMIAARSSERQPEEHVLERAH